MILIKLFYLVYWTAHVLASVLSMFLLFWTQDLCELGSWLWRAAVLLVALLLADLTGRLRLRSWWTAMIAGLTLPLTCAGMDLALREKLLTATPALWGFLLSFLLLQVYLLLRTPRREGPRPRRYAAPGAAAVIWLYLLCGAMFVMLVFGFLLVIILGALLSGNRGLLEYEGIAGLLLGIGGLGLLQAVWWLLERRSKAENTEFDLY